MNLHELKVKLQDLFEDNKVKEAFELLKQELNREVDIYSKFISIKRRYKNILDRKMAGTIDFTSSEIEINKISHSLLNFINEISNEDIGGVNVPIHVEVSNQILVVTNDKETVKIQDFFYQLNLINVTVKTLGFLSKVNYNKYDLIIFDNRDLQPCYTNKHLETLSLFDSENILKRVKLMEKTLKTSPRFIIHYGDFLYWINSNRERIQAANSQFSLYARTREVIEFINTYRV